MNIPPPPPASDEMEASEASRSVADPRRKYLMSLGIGISVRQPQRSDADSVIAASAPAALSPLRDRAFSTPAKVAPGLAAGPYGTSAARDSASAWKRAANPSEPSTAVAVPIPMSTSREAESSFQHSQHSHHNQHQQPPPRRRNTVSRVPSSPATAQFGSATQFGFDPDEASSDSENESPGSHQFIPPHELMAQHSKGFNVGTAHSVAVWEKSRRNKANVY